MTHKEALEHLKLHEYWADFSWMDEVAELAIEAIEKRIPKKPNDIFCPTCGNMSVTEEQYEDRYNYCFICGQAIDWRKKEDGND